MKEEKHFLTSTHLVSIVLTGTLEKRLGRNDGNGSVVCDELERQVSEILFREKDEIPIIRENFYFDNQGAFPYSEAVHEAISRLQEFRDIRYVMGENGEIVRPGAATFGQGALRNKLVSPKDYQKLFDLGKKIRVRDVIYI